MKTKIIHHVNRDFTHQVVEKITTLFGYVVNRTLITKFL
jgi:hypothetical protein